MSVKKPLIIFLYNRLFDPLIQGNFWLYIKDFLTDSDCPTSFHVVTFEDPNFPLSNEQKALLSKWQEQGLEWTPLTWHSGMGLGRKLVDILSGFLAVAKLRRLGFKHILALGSIAGAFAYMCALPLRMRLFLYQYEPHSDVSVASGAWSADSLQYKLTSFFEKRSAEYASVIASGTRFMGERLKNDWKVRGEFFRIPTVVNESKFAFNEQTGAEVRSLLRVSPNQPVLFYTGKFGGLYYAEEIPRAFKLLLGSIPNLHFLIVTPNDDEYVHALFDSAGVGREHYSVCHSSYDEIEKFYFVGDLGLITIPPGPGQEFRSSIKVGEYLCSGMPFLTPAGVSEDYVHATEQDVGVVVQDYGLPEIQKAIPEIQRYLAEDKQTRRKRCREFGVEYRGFSALNPVFRKAISALVAK